MDISEDVKQALSNSLTISLEKEDGDLVVRLEWCETSGIQIIDRAEIPIEYLLEP